MSEGRILVVEDDPTMQRLLRSQLAARGFEVQAVDNGADALDVLADWEPNLGLLDIGLKGEMDGLELCRRIREWSELPLILVSARDAPKTKELALELGADDYITKPFYVGELVARVRAVLRRAVAASARMATTALTLGELRIDMARRKVTRSDVEVHLTKTEFELLREFVTHPEKTLTYEYLLDTVWGGGYDDPRLVHAHVCNLRRKLEGGPGGPRHIVGMSGVGYYFRLEGAPAGAGSP